MDLFQLVFFVAVIGVGIWYFRKHRAQQQALVEDAEKAEAMFKSMFPELQPHLHPSRVVEHVNARVKRGPVGGTWEDPPGFPAAKRAVLEDTPKGERTVLEDAAGKAIAEFLYLEGDRPDVLGILRLGPAKYRVNNRGHASYWHPDREFKWKGPGKWTFTSRVADDSIDTDDGGTSWSDRTTTMGTAALAGGAAGAAAASATHRSTDTSY